MPIKKLTIDEVKHVAKLANLRLTESELDDFQEKLSDTVAYINDLNKLDTNGIVPTPQVTNKTNELRSDEVHNSLTQEQALKNAPKTHNGYFVTDDTL